MNHQLHQDIDNIRVKSCIFKTAEPNSYDGRGMHKNIKNLLNS